MMLAFFACCGLKRQPAQPQRINGQHYRFDCALGWGAPLLEGYGTLESIDCRVGVVLGHRAAFLLAGAQRNSIHLRHFNFFALGTSVCTTPACARQVMPRRIIKGQIIWGNLFFLISDCQLALAHPVALPPISEEGAVA